MLPQSTGGGHPEQLRRANPVASAVVPRLQAPADDREREDSLAEPTQLCGPAGAAALRWSNM
jgi:hypothetical protein